MKFLRKPRLIVGAKAVPEPIRVEIELSKTASREAKAEAEQANKQLNDLLVTNGFTLKLYLATGGHYEGRKK